MADAIRRAVHEIMDETVLADVRRALEAGDVEGAMDAIRFDLGEEELQRLVPRAIRDAFEAGGEAEAARLSTSFQLINPAALDYVRERAAALIREFGDTSRDAVRDLIHQSIGGELTPAELAEEVLDSGIGLNARQATALDNYREGLIESEEYSAREVEQLTSAYYERALEYRSRMIARTEVIAAETAGNQELWRQAAERGLLDRSEARQKWVVSSRPCPICKELEGQLVPIGGTFPGGFTGPPAHPNCECGVVMLPKGEAAAAA